MIYEYHCNQCTRSVDVIKPVSEFDKEELCDLCHTKMIRAFAPQKLHLFNTAVQDAYFHPALGKVVRGDNHAKKLAKEKGMIEVGNERPEKHLQPKLNSYDY